MHVQCTCICTYAYVKILQFISLCNVYEEFVKWWYHTTYCVCTILHTWFLSLSIRILHRLKNLSLKKNLFKFLSAQNFRNHSKIHWTMRKKIRYYQYNIFLPSKYFLDMFHVHLLYTIREIQIYITDYMHCRLALFYIWQMTRVR